MKDREEAVKRVHELLDEDIDKSALHFGRVELRMLLDFIYEGPPTKKEEEIK